VSLTPIDLAILKPEEQSAYVVALDLTERGEVPGVLIVARLLATIDRLAAPGELVADGTGPLLDPDCRDGKCSSCIGPPCEHSCHTARRP
jgi:hypothetical protein